jgi:YVTN family beta-propeller protein
MITRRCFFRPGTAVALALALGGLHCLPDREPTAPVEIARPMVLKIQPDPGSVVVPAGGSIQMVFDDVMDVSSFEGRFFLRDFSGTDLPGTFRGVDTTVLFTPLQPLAPSTLFTAELRGGVRDKNGNTIQQESVPIYSDTSTLLSTWFYSEGGYSQNGFTHVYLRDRKEGSVRVFGAFDSLLTTVTGFANPEGMALSPDGGLLFVSNRTANRVDVVNTATNAVVGSLATASGPSSIVTSGDTAYVLCVDASGRAALSKLGIAALDTAARVPLAFPGARLAISPDGETLYSLDQSRRDLVLFRPGDGSIIKRLANAVSTSIITGDLVVNHATGNVYVCNAKGFNVKMTDAAATAFTTVATFPSGAGGSEPVAIAFDPTGLSMYAVAAGRWIVTYDVATNTPRDTLAFTDNAKALCVVPSGDLLYAIVNVTMIVADVRTLTLLSTVEFASSGIEAVISSPQKFAAGLHRAVGPDAGRRSGRSLHRTAGARQ